MPAYRVYRLKDSLRQQFRWAPHMSGLTAVKPKDYIEGEEIEAPSLYAAWHALRESNRPLQVGDLLSAESGELRICKYVGFEEACWALPDPAAGQPSGDGGQASPEDGPRV